MKIDRHNLSKETLGRLLDEIHDRWFDLDVVVESGFEEASGEWRLHFKEGKRARCCKWLFGGWEIEKAPDGPFVRTLKITGVRAFGFRDTARIGFYQISHLKVKPEKHRITLKAEPALRITLEVDRDFTISVE